MSPSNLIFAICIFRTILTAAAYENLLTYAFGESGALLGSQFGLPGTNATYDYVIVGGGTGGLAIATRLAEDRGASVAVVEAGGFYEIDNGNLSTVPGYANYYTGADPTNYQPLVDWGFSTVPQAVGVQAVRFYAAIGIDTSLSVRAPANVAYIMLEEKHLEDRRHGTTLCIKGRLRDSFHISRKHLAD